MDGHQFIDGSLQDVDETLIQLMGQGDDHALRLFYKRHGRFVYSLALSVVHERLDAEEVASEAFTRAWEHAGSFDPQRATVKGWLAMITRRLAIDRTRSRAYKARQQEVAVGTGAIDGDGSLKSSDDHHLQNAQSRRVQEALKQLDEPYRDLIRLSYFEGMSHSGIADHLDTPLGTVKTRLREAIRQLRANLGIEVQ
ncbi:sigma-70 family RNA polymerase sigma factor [candidate division GN15 bacterium]|nr:sigma-70 family RNA polymerase sigma factor [candidate division GN15 bacterium]